MRQDLGPAGAWFGRGLAGPRRIGARPDRPFVHLLSTGSQLLASVSIDGLPHGLTFDPAKGVIAGRTPAAGEYRLRVRWEGEDGPIEDTFEIVVGDQLCLTPPLGWNSWNGFGAAVTVDDVRATAAYLLDSGLAARGWTAVNIDDGWQGERDQRGRLQPNEKFGDLAALCAELHAQGLRAGIYSSPGPTTCGGFVGSAGHEADDALAFAQWGFDYLKYDWCSAGPHRDDTPLETLVAPYALMRAALDNVDRDVVYHLCQYGMGQVWLWARDRVGANAWRTTGDIDDTWASVDAIGFGQSDLADFAGPGGWNDPDMLVVGSLGGAWNRPIARTRLTEDEERTHLTLWILLAAPLLVGCDVRSLPESTLALLRNPVAIAIHQDGAGHQARRVRAYGAVEIWRKALADGTSAVGVFNRGDASDEVGFDWPDIGVPGLAPALDVWDGAELPADAGWQGSVPAHGCALLLVRP